MTAQKAPIEHEQTEKTCDPTTRGKRTTAHAGPISGRRKVISDAQETTEFKNRYVQEKPNNKQK
jgi:hypothetical protein